MIHINSLLTSNYFNQTKQGTIIWWEIAFCRNTWDNALTRLKRRVLRGQPMNSDLDHWPLTLILVCSSLNLSEGCWQIWRNSVEVFLRHCVQRKWADDWLSMWRHKKVFHYNHRFLKQLLHLKQNVFCNWSVCFWTNWRKWNQWPPASKWLRAYYYYNT